MTPEGWRRVRLSEIAARLPNAITDGPFGSNLKLSDYVEDGVPVLQGKNITNDKFSWFDIRYISHEKASELRRSQVREGDILLVKIGSIGYAAVIDSLHGHACAVIPANLAKITVNESSVERDFLFQWLTSPLTKQTLQQLASRTAQPALSLEKLKALDVLLPPLPEQRKIAAILTSVDEAIEATQAVIDQLQVVKKAMMAELLTRGLPGRHTRFKMTEIGEVPEGWGVARLGELATVGNGSTPSKQRADYWLGGRIPWLPTGKVNDRVISEADEFITDRALRECPVRLLPRGTLLMAMIGQGKTRGMVAYLDMEATINQNFASIQPRGSIRSWFLFAYLDHNYSGLRSSGRGSNQDALNCSIIKQYPVPVPPPDEQRGVEELLLVLEEKIERERQVLEGRLALKSALLSALLTGELRVRPDPPETKNAPLRADNPGLGR